MVYKHMEEVVATESYRALDGEMCRKLLNNTVVGAMPKMSEYHYERDTTRSGSLAEAKEVAAGLPDVLF